MTDTNSYPHDRDWEIPPDERNNTPTPRAEAIDDAAIATSYASGSRHNPHTSRRRSRTQPRHHQYQDTESPPEETNDEPSALTRLLKRMFAPVLGFILISLISLTWSAILIAGMMSYTALGYSITGYVALLSVLIWCLGEHILLKLLYFGVE